MTRPSARALLLGTASAVIAFAAFGTAQQADAHVTRIVIEKKASPAFDGATFGAAGQYETLAGNAYGELDPNDPPQRHHHRHQARAEERARHGRVHRHLPDREADRHVEGEPPDVARRAQPRRAAHHRRRASAISAMSGFPAAGRATLRAAPPGREQRLCHRAGREECRRLARSPDASSARIMNASGADSSAMFIHTNPMPYKPVDLDTAKATLTTHTRRNASTARSIGETEIKSDRLGLGQMRRRAPVPRHAGPDADLRQGRLRSEAAVSGRLHREGPAGAGHRLRGVPRRRLVLQVREGGRRRHAPTRLPARSSGSITRGQSQSGN